MDRNRQAEIEETERALEILRGRKASFDRANRTFWLLALPFVAILAVIGALLLPVVVVGLIAGEIHYWALLFGILFAGVVLLRLRMFAKDATPMDFLQGLIGYRRSDGAILDEQIAEFEQRLMNLRQEREPRM